MPSPGGPGRIYSATYSHVPVYELMVDGDQIMRRRVDDYVNATHILKAADFDKPARTRILEREVQKGIHEKVQGGYGKYQGTWIPLVDARMLAEKNGVFEKLRSIFEFTPGAHSPPPAPKHATAASAKPRAPRQSTTRRVPVQTQTNNHRASEMSYENYSTRETPDHASIRSQTPIDYLDPGSRYSTQGHRKRKRGMDEPMALSPEEQAHLMWTDELLDYFMLQDDPDPLPGPPEPPASVDLDRAVDDKGHTPMHWAAAIGDINLIHDFVQRGARIDSQALNGETPLMRAVLFTNNYDKQTMDQLINVLIQTVPVKDQCLSTVFHHIAATTNSKTKYTIARYYLQTILLRMETAYAPGYIAQLLDLQDQHGDTAILIAARYGARRCIRLLLDYGASTEIPNQSGETAQALIAALNARRRERHGGQLNILSSSPVRDMSGSHHPLAGGVTEFPAVNGTSAATPSKRPRTSYRSEAANLLSSQLGILVASRAEQLAAEFEKEVADREAEVADNIRVLEARRMEVDRLRIECERLVAAEKTESSIEYNGQTMHLVNDEMRIDEEAQRLEDELRSILESSQASELSNLIANADQEASTLNGQMDSVEDSKQQRDTLLRAVLDQQERRRLLLSQIIEAGSLASDFRGCITILTSGSGSEGESEVIPDGHNTLQQNGGGTPPSSHPPVQTTTHISSKRSQYTRLIRSALNLPAGEDEGIEDLLPEMLRELEETKREREEVAASETGGVIGGVSGGVVSGGGVSGGGVSGGGVSGGGVSGVGGISGVATHVNTDIGTAYGTGNGVRGYAAVGVVG